MTENVEHRDALVIGGGLAGLSVAHFLERHGCEVAVIEKQPIVGGIDRSFDNGHGRWFDYGVHALDYMRSPMVTELFEEIMQGRIHKVERKRAMVMRGHVVRYNTTAEEWPEALRALLRDGPLVDDLLGREPSRKNLAEIYGPAFVDMIFDETLHGYPSETRHLEFGVPESKLMGYIYPWFFPRVPRRTPETRSTDPKKLSEQFQAQRREQHRDFVLYPDEGGFGNFSLTFAERLQERGVEVIAGVDDLEFDLDTKVPHVERVRAKGRWYSSDQVYWCAPPGVLYRLLGRHLPKLTPDQYVLGSFQFARPLSEEFNEILVGDPDHAVNRMSFTGSFAQGPNDQIQLEHAFPKEHARKGWTQEEWQASWLRTLRALGILQDGNELVHLDFKTFPILYNTFGIDGTPTPEVDFSDFAPDSNLLPVLPTLNKVNINTRVPMFKEFVDREMARTRKVRGT